MEIRTKTIMRLRDALLKSGQRPNPVRSSADRTLAREGLLSARENDALERVAPAAECMFLVIAADEQVTESELAALRGAIRGLAGDVLSDELIVMMMEGFALRLKEEGVDARLAELTSVLHVDEMRSVFGLAAAAALADNQLADEEGSVLEKVKSACRLSDEDVASILGELADDTD